MFILKKLHLVSFDLNSINFNLNVNIFIQTGEKILKYFFQEQLDYLLMPPPTSTPVRHIISPARVR